MKKEKSGVQFEKVVAEIQRQLDPGATVQHNEFLTNRLGHQRQFDVVFRGVFGGHDVLGVIECKDLKRKVGLAEVEAFVTKSRDINANLKMLVSRKGFTKSAIETAKDHGVQTLSLIPTEDSAAGLVIGQKWYASIYNWEQISIQLHFETEPTSPVNFSVEDARIADKRVMDWFTNHILENYRWSTELGWSVGVKVPFDGVQTVTLKDASYAVTGVSFFAKRGRDRKERMVGLSGVGFYDWQNSQFKPTPGSTLTTQTVPTDFTQWKNSKDEKPDDNAFIHLTFDAFAHQFDFISDALDLEAL